MKLRSLTRRNLLRAGAVPLLLRAAPPDNRVTQENRKAGTAEWQLAHYSFDRATGSGLRSPRLEGYASEVSAYPGEKIEFLISTDPPRRFSIDLYRTGYY